VRVQGYQNSVVGLSADGAASRLKSFGLWKRVMRGECGEVNVKRAVWTKISDDTYLVACPRCRQAVARIRIASA
jgi:hypothetical protein